MPVVSLILIKPGVGTSQMAFASGLCKTVWPGDQVLSTVG